MTAYYNEIDPFAAAWLRELIKAGLIAPGDVDERSIEDVTPMDLVGYTQCHFFAGIGGWSRALRLAGWPDDRPAWTGSCPCQPFSAAGKRGGFADERHLWPAWFWLIGECRPDVIFGEQVASADGRAWLDVVLSDLEGADYTVGAADLCAAGVGAPHRRQRLWFVADAGRRDIQHIGPELGTAPGEGQGRAQEWERIRPDLGHGGDNGGMADAKQRDCGGQAEAANHRQQKTDRSTNWFGRYSGTPNSLDSTTSARHERAGEHGGRLPLLAARFEQRGTTSRMAQPECPKWRQDNEHDQLQRGWQQAPGGIGGRGPTNGFWANAEWLPCRDGKARPTQPGVVPLAHGIPGRVGRLRGYGNAIVPQVAAEFIGAYQEALR